MQDKGKTLPWNIDSDDWSNKLADKRAQATNKIDGTWNDSTGTWQHAASIGATSTVREHSIQYAQWSMATEEAILENNPEAERKPKQLGRGQPAKYKWETIANHSADLPVEHLIWSQPQPIARAGTDLFSTLCAASARKAGRQQ